MKKIAVLMGGTSSEREVSLQSGKNVAEALASLGKYDVVPVVLDADDLAAMPKDVPAQYVMLPFDVKLKYMRQPWCTVRLEVGYDEIGDARDAVGAIPRIS